MDKFDYARQRDESLPEPLRHPAQQQSASFDVTSTFPERLKIAIRHHHKSVRSFAEVCGLSEAVIRKYLVGSEPTRPALVAIAHTSNVSLEWLATGAVSSTEGSAIAAQRNAARQVAAELRNLADKLEE